MKDAERIVPGRRRWPLQRLLGARSSIHSGDAGSTTHRGESNWTGQRIVVPALAVRGGSPSTGLEAHRRIHTWGPAILASCHVCTSAKAMVCYRAWINTRQFKDFWTHAVVFTSKDQNLNKAHVQYLEAQLHRLAARVPNAAIPTTGTCRSSQRLSEADVQTQRAFWPTCCCASRRWIRTCLEAAKASGRRTDGLAAQGEGHRRSRDRRPGRLRGARRIDAVKTEVPSIHTYLADLRRTLIAKGVLVDAGDYRLTQDYTFNSPSTARGVSCSAGRPMAASNGRMQGALAQGTIRSSDR